MQACDIKSGACLSTKKYLPLYPPNRHRPYDKAPCGKWNARMPACPFALLHFLAWATKISALCVQCGVSAIDCDCNNTSRMHL